MLAPRGLIAEEWQNDHPMRILVAGMMSGLTLGLLTLDITSLMVLKNSGPPKERMYAARIIPLVQHKHLLLVTLLLCNAGIICLNLILHSVSRICYRTTPSFHVEEPMSLHLLSLCIVCYFIPVTRNILIHATSCHGDLTALPRQDDAGLSGHYSIRDLHPIFWRVCNDRVLVLRPSSHVSASFLDWCFWLAPCG